MSTKHSVSFQERKGARKEIWAENAFLAAQRVKFARAKNVDLALDLEEGQKLRCPYPDCEVRPDKFCPCKLFQFDLVGGKQADEAAAAEHTLGEEPRQAEEVGRAGREARSLFKIQMNSF